MEFNKQWFLDMSVYRSFHLRKGQFIFNEVHKLFPDEADILVKTVHDCFYLDEKIDLFLEKVRQLVESKPPSFAEFVEDLSKEGFNTSFKLLNDTSFKLLNDGKQGIDAEKELFKALSNDMQTNYKRLCIEREYFTSLTREKEYKPKVFYRLGESMGNRRLRRGAKI